MADQEAPATNPEADEQAKTLKMFAELLHEPGMAGLHLELSEAMSEVAAACDDTRKKGSVTLKFTFAPQKDLETLLVTPDVKAVVPRGDRKPALYYVQDGRLERNNPNQQQFSALRDAGGGVRDHSSLKEAKSK